MRWDEHWKEREAGDHGGRTDDVRATGGEPLASARPPMSAAYVLVAVVRVLAGLLSVQKVRVVRAVQ